MILGSVKCEGYMFYICDKKIVNILQVFFWEQGKQYWRQKMGEILGSHDLYLLQKMKILITDSTPLASKERKGGLLENLLFCCTLQMQVKAGKEYLLVLSFLGIW